MKCFSPATGLPAPSERRKRRPGGNGVCLSKWLASLLGWVAAPWPQMAAVLWSLSGPILVSPDTRQPVVLPGVLARDDASSDTLYIRFHVAPLDEFPDPQSEVGLELWLADRLQLGVGKARGVVGYSAYLAVTRPSPESAGVQTLDLRSGQPEPVAGQTGSRFEVPRRGRERTLVVKVQYMPETEDLVTVWLDPDLGPGANEIDQPDTLRTEFYADATFDRILLRCRGPGAGWWFSDLAVATTFRDFVESSSVPLMIRSEPTTRLPRFEARSWPLFEQARWISPCALAITREGYLWLGGENGLLRFDGQQFETIHLPEACPPPIVHLAADRAGTLWVLNAVGRLAALGQHGWQSPSSPADFPADGFRILLADRTGIPWLVDSRSVWFRSGTQWIRCKQMQEIDPSEIRAVFPDPAEGIWIYRDSGQLHRLRPGVDPPEVLPLPNLPPDSPLVGGHVTASGSLWLATPRQIWMAPARNSQPDWRPVWHASGSEHVVRLWGPANASPRALLNSGHWLVWNAQTASLTRHRVFSAEEPIVTATTEGEGTIWLLTRERLVRLQARWRTPYDIAQGLPRAPVVGITEVAPGVLWTAISGEGLFQWTGHRFVRLITAGIPPRDPVLTLLAVTSEGSCWVGTPAGLLRFKDPLAVADEVQLVGPDLPTALALAEDPYGAIWIGTAEGELWRLHQGARHRLALSSENRPITTLLWVDATLWIGTRGTGLWHLSPQQMDRAQPVSLLQAREIYTLYPGSESTVWAATDTGLWRHRNQAWQRAYPRPPEPSEPVWGVAEDGLGRLWWAGPRGLQCGQVTDTPDAAPASLSPLGTWPWTEISAAPAEVSPAAPRALWFRAADGALWLARGTKLERLEPAFAPVTGRPFSIHLQRVRVGDRVVWEQPGPMASATTAGGRPEPELKLGRGGPVEIAFAVLGAATDEVRTLSRLEGLDTEWQEVGRSRRLVWGQLPPGRYSLCLRAEEQAETRRTAEATLALVVQPSLWQRPWLTGTLILALLMTGTVAARWRERRRARARLQKIARQHALERERARIARDLHDEMGGKLCRVSFLSEHLRRTAKDPVQWEATATAIGEIARGLLRSLDEIVWAVNPANDTLEHLAAYLSQFAQDFFHGTPVECHVDLPESLPTVPVSAQVRHHLFLAIQEAFTNVLKHSGANRVEFRLRYSDDTLECLVRDNGRGFDPHQTPAGIYPGHGLHNLRVRLAEVGGQCSITARPGAGTEIRLIWTRPPGDAS